MSNTSADQDPLPLSQVLADECAALHGIQIVLSPTESEPERLTQVYTAIHRLTPARTALCFSGGGIRSATFGLGILQGLARFKLLVQFDYLSTVSGGGYIGGWLTAWIKRHPGGNAGVMAELGSPPESALSPDPLPVAWLRAFSNYVTPRLGLFSADGWTIVSTYLRNLFTNWLMLIPLIAAVLAFPRIYVALVSQTKVASWVTIGFFLAGCAFLSLALTYLHLYRPSLKTLWRSPLWERFETEKYVILACLVPTVLSAVLLTTSWAWFRNAGGTLEQVNFLGLSSRASFLVGGAFIHVASWLFSVVFLRSRFTRWLAVELEVIAGSGALGGLFAWLGLVGMDEVLAWLTAVTPSSRYVVKDYAEWYTWFAIPVYLALFLLVTTVTVLVASRFTTDDDREWLGRAGAWVMMVGFAWGLVSGLVIVSSVLLALFLKSLGSLITYLGGALGTIATLVGAYSSKTRATGDEPVDKQTLIADLTVRYVAAPVFILFVMAVISLGTSLVVKGVASGLSLDVDWKPLGLLLPEDPSEHLNIIHNAPLWLIAQVWIFMVILGIQAASFLDINKFSLHAMYRDRLVRAYLGASRREEYATGRRPNSFTGFDPDDNFQMHHLSSTDQPLQRPFLVVNTALNLVSGRHLAWQQRKAQSFTISPLHCGSWFLGYRRSAQYGRNPAGGGAITLGTALAISGAAASPNMGYHSSPAVTFLMTLFNIRLGWWLGNPGRAGRSTFQRSSPQFAVGPMLYEALGLTDELRPYVYLSDGGHFENLGLYEMVLRRCSSIMVVDAGCDDSSTFEDLGNAIRKIRIDLGIDIDIDPSLLRPNKQRRVQHFYAIGTIHYDRTDHGAKKGILIYVKPSLMGDEPTDVIEYASRHKQFPHEPTIDQFFDEAQFESYRLLGQHIVDQVFSPALKSRSQTLHRVFEELHSHSTRVWI